MKAQLLLAMLAVCTSLPAQAFDNELGRQTDASFVDELAKCWAFLGLGAMLMDKNSNKDAAAQLGQAARKAESIALMLTDKSTYNSKKDVWLKSLSEGDTFKSPDSYKQTNSACLAAISNPSSRYRYWNAQLRQQKQLAALPPLDLESSTPALQKAVLHYQTKDFDKALALALPLAEAGDHEAQSLTGSIYANASGKLHNLPAAESWLQKAADSGNLAAQFDLAQLYLFYLQPANNLKGQQWMLTAANRGHPAAQTWVGLMTLNGVEQVAKDELQGLSWLLLAQEGGDLTASVTLKKMADRFSPAQQTQAQQRAGSWMRQP